MRKMENNKFVFAFTRNKNTVKWLFEVTGDVQTAFSIFFFQIETRKAREKNPTSVRFLCSAINFYIPHSEEFRIHSNFSRSLFLTNVQCFLFTLIFRFFFSEVLVFLKYDFFPTVPVKKKPILIHLIEKVLFFQHTRAKKIFFLLLAFLCCCCGSD